jgi:hypothetical protein
MTTAPTVEKPETMKGCLLETTKKRNQNMQQEKNMYRQGDVLFIRTDTVPEEASEDKTMVIVEGEATGPAHRLRAGRGVQLLRTLAGIAYVKAAYEAYVDHEEHETITLPPGNWEARRQREYTPASYRYVQD